MSPMSEDRYIAEPGWEDALEGLPRYLQDPIRRYLESHLPPGRFLQSVICNDLANALTRMDPASFYDLRNLVQFFYTYAPSPCHGSRQAYENWIRLPSCARCGEDFADWTERAKAIHVCTS